MDPILIGAWTRPIVFFMTRSDVFTPITKPILWACHMLPIYRQHDGVDTKEKNQEVFRRSSNVLKFGRNLLIFGEGFTDDTFIRRLKPVKKGAVRMGFITLESINWSKKVYIRAMGINYSEPNRMRSDFLVSYSEPICLNDYREAFEENPTKTITDITRQVEKMMQDQITHVEDFHLASYHEKIMILTRKGMNPVSFDRAFTLEERWRYSQKLAKRINSIAPDTEYFSELKEDLNHYFDKIKRKDLDDDTVFAALNGEIPKRMMTSRIKMLLLALPMVLGLIHFFLPYRMAKSFAEKKFKRKVFWGSVKVVTGMILMGLYNIPFIFLFHSFVYPSWLLALSYYWLTPFFGLAAYIWFMEHSRLKNYKKVNYSDLTALRQEREELLRRIDHHFTI
jgi:hypothetical protein